MKHFDLFKEIKWIKQDNKKKTTVVIINSRRFLYLLTLACVYKNKTDKQIHNYRLGLLTLSLFEKRNNHRYK